jgi:hypothetical protein
MAIHAFGRLQTIYLSYFNAHTRSKSLLSKVEQASLKLELAGWKLHKNPEFDPFGVGCISLDRWNSVSSVVSTTAASNVGTPAAGSEAQDVSIIATKQGFFHCNGNCALSR